MNPGDSGTKVAAVRTGRCGGRGAWFGALAILVWAGSVHAAENSLGVDFSVRAGTFRRLHGINKGPLAPGGIVQVIAEQKALGIPFTRLHDCGWPNPYVVDHHAVFPDAKADPTLPASYDFRLTDEYIEAVRQTGAEPVYRLGQSIEHTSVKRHVHPPSDPAKWTAVCLGIIRHYNEGWADGFRHGIRYWEIWNEPENRPVMWTGTDDDYLRLYRVAATTIKKEFPGVKVGGPSLGASGSWVRGEFVPTEFAVRFLDLCRQEKVPLDFFSWHCYTANTTELVARARAIRQLLDAKGFAGTESHLNEWNYLPGNSWDPIGKTATPLARQAHYAAMAGAPGAAFIAAALIELQDAPVDVGNLFHGEVGAFGLFNEHGVPQKAYDAMLSFQGLMEAPRRVAVRGAVPGKLALAAGLSQDARTATVLVVNQGDARDVFELNWSGLGWSQGAVAEIRRVDGRQDSALSWTERVAAEPGVLRLELKAPALALVRLRVGEG